MKHESSKVMFILCHRFYLLSTMMLLILSIFSCHFISEAAHSRTVIVRRAQTKRYDREITTFDPTGRLLQVEYGLRAAERGSSICAFIHNNSVYVIVGKKESQETADSSFSSSCSLKAHRIDEHVYLFTSGLTGDALFLAHYLRQFSQKHRMQFGEPPTLSEVGRFAAEIQHSLTGTGGARPLGCSALIAGVDPDTEDVRLFLSHPGGSSEDVLYSAIGENSLSHLKLLSDELATIMDKGVKPAISKLVKEVGGSGSVDVWLLRCDINRRGATSCRCFANAMQDSVSQILVDDAKPDLA